MWVESLGKIRSLRVNLLKHLSQGLHSAGLTAEGRVGIALFIIKFNREPSSEKLNPEEVGRFELKFSKEGHPKDITFTG